MSRSPAVCVINVVGLTARQVASGRMPHLARFAASAKALPMEGVLPAVTCSAQATMLTGALPADHGIVGNGWFSKEWGEIKFWSQSHALIQGETLFQAARARAAREGQSFTCAQLFWWFNQGAPVEWSITPKPHYGADGSKVFGVTGSPEAFPDWLERQLGSFPFQNFWGPLAGLPSTQWIARATALTLKHHRPSLTLTYLPHLDYDLQRFGPEHPAAGDRLAEVDACVGEVLRAVEEIGGETVVVSEYGLQRVHRPVLLNRILRQEGWLVVRDGPFGEMLDVFRSKAFAVVDHQLAHLYVQDLGILNAVKARLEREPGVARIADPRSESSLGLGHPRSGHWVALAERDAWFAYPYWLDDRRAPDFARTVDIHRKPGYDPCELLFDPGVRFPKLRAGFRLTQKRLGFRMLMDVVPLDPTLVKGSHGVPPADPLDGPVIIAKDLSDEQRSIPLTAFKSIVLQRIFHGSPDAKRPGNFLAGDPRLA